MRKIIFALALLMIGSSAFAQHRRKKKKTSFSHAFGGSYVVYTEADNAAAGQDLASVLNYTPRFNFYRVPKKDIVASIGTDVELGFNFSSYGGVSYTNFTYQIPVILSLNFGHAAHPDSKSGFGGFVGAGYNFHSKTFQISPAERKNLMLKGIVVQGGLRFMMQGRSATLKVSYTKSSYDLTKLGGIGDYNLNILSLGLSTNIGEY